MRKPPLATLLNILWNVPGLGFVAAAVWALVGCVMALSIVGLPWSKACFILASFTLAPFGRQMMSRRDVTGQDTLGTGAVGTLGNIVWFLVAGLWLMILHVGAACALATTVIGIPFAWAHLKLAAAAIAPVGKIVVPVDVADAIARDKAEAAWRGMRPP